MIRITGQIFVFVSAVLIGWLRSMRLDDAVCFWARFRDFVRYVEDHFRYLSRTTAETVAEYDRTQPYFAPAAECAAQCRAGAEFPSAWQQAVQTAARRGDVPPQGIRLLTEFGAGLGATDLSGQLAHCALYRQLCEEQRAASLEEKQKKSRMYVLLGAAAGLGLNLLLL